MELGNIHNADDGYYVNAVLGNGNDKELDLSEVMFLHIQHYSNHPNVALAAQVLPEELQKDGKTIRGHKGYFSAAKKLIASIYMHEGDLFRFSTKRGYLTGSKRKQVWLTPKTLTLFNTMPDYPDLPRSAHKEFINIIFNAETKEKAARRIMTATRYWNVFEDCEVIQTYGGKQIRT